MTSMLIARRDLEFAFQLEELRLFEQIGLLDDRQRDRIDHLHDLFGDAATAATNAEARCADLEERILQLEQRRAKTIAESFAALNKPSVVIHCTGGTIEIRPVGCTCCRGFV